MKIPFNDVFLFRNKEYKILFGPPPPKKKSAGYRPILI